MNISPVGFTLTLLALAGAASIAPLESSLRGIGAATATSRGQLAAQAGHGVILATLGGGRTLTADLLWLKTNLAWEHEDLAATRAWLDLVVAVDERPDYFWLNGARIIAYDMPVWRERAQAGAPAAIGKRAREEQAQAALKFLQRALELRGPNAALYGEMAGIQLRVRHDPAHAAEYFRLAAECPGAPFYAARIYAELLISLDRKREARDWLRQLLPQLPADQPEARRAVVADRLAALERDLASGP